MRTLKLTIQYDGTDYVGWQRQPNGVSIQELLERAIEPIEGRPVAIVGAGRTDAGVHALGQVASVQLEAVIDLATLARALNATLPGDVRVALVEEAAPDFNARFSATGKVYDYRIWNGPFLPPFERRYAWHVPQPLDVDRMREAARPLAGTHDFSAFRAAGSDVATSERTIRDLRIDAGGPRVTLTVAADGFLRYMVRTIAGTLVDAGLGRRPVESVGMAIASRDRAQAGPTAPAQGLVLVRVEY
ncbi:MAG: tRNA pseudouridine(38-40) synthase TruA [Vicinamibacterales bacterium]